MTVSDLKPSAPAGPVASTGRGLKIALAVSVGLNLAIAGLATGAWLKDGPAAGRGASPLGFGAFAEALSREDRRALRRALMTQAPSFRATRAAVGEEIAALVAALRAEPFAPEAVTSALAAIGAHHVDRLQLGRDLIEAHLIGMPEANRKAFADRVEAKLSQGD